MSILVPAYNEERNIDRLLLNLSRQKTKRVKIKEIVVVSHSNDSTDAIVGDWEMKDKRIHLVKQNRRAGKVAAFNDFLHFASGDILWFVLSCILG